MAVERPKNPGPSVFPDYSKPAAREWWGGLFKRLTDIGIAGIWNDMNEPAAFVAPSWTVNLDVRHDNDGQPTDHREIHNVYGQLMTRATFEGLLKLKPDERPFVLTRATFSGGQRYASLWAGDNQSRWEDFRHSLPILMGLGIAGMPFVGVDIGGFGENPTAELFTRWLQAGVFYPFMRIHTADGTADQEPWSYGVDWEPLNRRAIELRYQLLPHIYNEIRRASETGLPILRPLFLDYPDDPRVIDIDDQFLFGSDLLIAPVLFEARTEREVYLPKGTWFDFYTGRQYAGGASIRVPLTMSSIPVFVRGGGLIFRQPVVQHTDEMPGQALRVFAYPSPSAKASLYEDAGQGFGYQKGDFVQRTFTQTRSGNAMTIEVGAADGRYRPKDRALEIVLVGDAPPARVRLDAAGAAGSQLDQVKWVDFAKATSGWSIQEDGTIVIRTSDRWDGLKVTIER